MKLIKKISLVSVLAIFGLAFFVSATRAQVDYTDDTIRNKTIESLNGYLDITDLTQLQIDNIKSKLNEMKEIDEMKEKLKNTNLSQEEKIKIESELEKIKKAGMMSQANQESLTELKDQIEKTNNSCFQKYSLGNDRMSVYIAGNENLNFSPGESVNLTFTVTNSSKIAIPDGNVFFQIEKIDSALENKDNNIKKVVAEFFVEEVPDLKGWEEKAIKHTLQLPKGMEAGTYNIAAYLLRGKNMNIGMFRKDILDRTQTGNGAQFSVNGDSEKEINLTEKVKINDTDYDGMGIDFEKNNTIKVAQTLNSSFESAKKATITKKLYHNNYLSEDNLIEESTEEIEIGSNSSKEITTQIEKDKLIKGTPFPHYLRTIITYDDQIIFSTVSIFDKKSSSIMSSYIPILEKFPIKKGENFNIGICSNNSAISNLKMEIDFKDKNGKIIETIQKDLSGGMNMMSSAGLASFSAKNDYDFISMETRIMNGDVVLDKYITIFSDDVNSIGMKDDHNSGNIFKTLLNIIIGLSIIGLIIWLVIVIKNKIDKGSSKTSGNIMGMFFAMIIVSGLLFANTSYAATTSPRSEFTLTQKNEIFAFDGEAGVGFDCGGPIGMAGIEAYTNYEMAVKGSWTGNLIPDSSTAIIMEIGDKLDIFFDNSFPIFGQPAGNASAYVSPIFDDLAYSGSGLGFDKAGGIDSVIGLLGGGYINGASIFGVVFDDNNLTKGGVGVAGFFSRPHVINAAASPYDVESPTPTCSNPSNWIADNSATYKAAIDSCCEVSGCPFVNVCKAVHTCGLVSSAYKTCAEVALEAKNKADMDCILSGFSGNIINFFSEIGSKLINNVGPTKLITKSGFDKDIVSCEVDGSGCVAGKAGITTLQLILPVKADILAYFPLLAWGCTINGPAFGFGGSLSKIVEIKIKVNPPPNDAPINMTLKRQGVAGSTSSGTVNSTYWFDVRATDAEGDAVQYEIDWRDGEHSYIPYSTGYTTQGVPQSRDHLWDTAGTYQIRARVKDASHAYSTNWAYHTITILNPPPVGKCGSADTILSYDQSWPASPEFCKTGTPTPGSPSIPTPGNPTKWSCKAAGGSSPCEACKEIACSDDVRDDYCDGQPIPGGCGRDIGCFGSLTCEEDARCCDGKWIEVKP